MSCLTRRWLPETRCEKRGRRNVFWEGKNVPSQEGGPRDDSLASITRLRASCLASAQCLRPRLS